MAYHSLQSSSGDDPEKIRQSMRDMFGPQAIDSAVRQVLSMCWMMLPDNKKTVAAVEAEVRRIVDRALEDLREDASAFGVSTQE